MEAGGTGEVMITLEGVEKWFDDFQALKGIDLLVGRQETVVICGPSGSGKSTLIRCINRLEVHDRGRIVVDGTELSDDVRDIQEIRRETGMVFQSFNLFPHLSILDNITLAPGRSATRRRRRPRRPRWAARAGQDPRAGAQVPGAALRGTAAARGDRPDPGDGAQGHPVRRADLRARPGDDQGGARHDGGTRRVGHDHDLRHPRDGLRPGRGRPRRLHGGGQIVVEVNEPESLFTNPQEERTRLFLSQIL
jgi:general L-amino acid transport system ATP-binding protein